MLLTLRLTDSKEEFAEDHSAHPDGAILGKQQPALKRTMRAQTGTLYKGWPKIGLKVIRWIRMRLNYQNSSDFGSHHVHSCLQLIHENLSNLWVKIYHQGHSIIEALLIAFRTGYKRVSLFIKTRVAYATGEVFPKEYTSITRGDGRGQVVPGSPGKGPKHPPESKAGRSYSTRSKKSCSAPVQEPRVIPKGQRILAKHWQVCYDNSNREYHDLRGIFKQESLWFAAYLSLKDNKGSKTKGPDEDIIDVLTKKRILELRDAVLKGTFTWTGVRQIRIPKTGKPDKFRPIGIPSINDRLVQEMLRTVIEPIFEIKFSNLSHGFRPNRSCHTALRWINTNMKDSIWFVEGDIENFFPSIDHKILMNKIQKRIKDPLILQLIRSGLKAKVFEKGRATYTPEVGTPQGDILSPLLSNIYLNELDGFMEQLNMEYLDDIKANNSKKKPKALKMLRRGHKSEYPRGPVQRTGHARTCSSYPLGVRLTPSLPFLFVEQEGAVRVKAPGFNPTLPKTEGFGRALINPPHNQVPYRNCKYIRYADYFIIGVLGSRSMAVEIRDRVRDYLKSELNLELSLENTKINHVSKGIRFLGYVFSRRPLFIKQSYCGKILTRKITIPILDVDMKRVITLISAAGFCDGLGKPTPAFRFLRLPQSETNIKVNNILRGLSEWATIAGNRKAAIARIAYIIRYSIAKVYAAKFKLGTIAAVFKKGGNDLSKPIGARVKSVVGANESSRKVQKSIMGILYDKYHKIPKPTGNKLKPDWVPEYIKVLKEKGGDAKFLEVIWDMKKRDAKNPLAAMVWRIEKALSSKG